MGVDGNPTFEKLKELRAAIKSGQPPSTEDLHAEIERLDLPSVGVPLDSGREMEIEDIEELTLISKIPTKEIDALEKSWKDGTKDSTSVLTELQGFFEQGIVPGGWLIHGA